MVAPFFETTLEPNAWEVHHDEWKPDRRWEVTWRPYQSPTDDIDLDLDETFAGRPAMDWPPGYPPTAYAHLYITTSRRDVLLDFHATSPARIWLNGQDVTEIETLPSGVAAQADYHPAPGDGPYRRPITLLHGINRLLIKLYFPQKDYGTGLDRPTRFRLRLLDVDGSPIQGWAYSLNNPRLYPPDLALRGSETAPEPGSCLADLTEVSITSKRPRHVFYSDQSVKLSAQVRLFNSEERIERFERDETRYDTQTFAGRISANLVSYYGDVPGREATEVEYGLEPSEANWDFGILPKGHYTLYCRLHLGGQLLKMPLPTMISVVDRPHPLPEGVTSKFGHSYYYLGLVGPEFVEVLAAGGVRFNIGSVHWWWLSKDPREWIKKPIAERKWTYTPKEEVLAAARKWGVELTGDLGGCWTAEYRKLRHPQWEIPEETKGKLVVINSYWPTYTYDSPEFVEMVREYVIPTVSKFKPHFRYWKQQNEVNQGRYGMTPEMWGPIIKATYEAAKEADPDCIIVNASMTGLGINFLEPLFQQGYDKYFDVIDYHVSAWPFYDPVDDLRGLKNLLALMDKYGVDKPLWDGEFGAYRSLWEDGARAQAGAWTRYMVCAHTYDRLELVGAHFIGYGGWSAASRRGQFPAYVAYRTCADNLEGATDHEQLSLGPQIAAYRFNQGGGRVTVVWTRDGSEKSVVIQVRKPQVRVVKMLGTEQTMPSRQGYIRLQVTGSPVYIRD